MSTRARVLASIAGISVSLAAAAPSLATDDPAQGVVWDLSPLFADNQAWDHERVLVEAALPTIARLKGTLGANANALLQGLDQISDLTRRMRRLAEYATLKADADSTSDAIRAQVEQISSLQSHFDQAASFLAPEILAIGRERVEAFENAEPAIAVHRRKIELILRRAAHTLEPAGESLLASAAPLREQPGAIHDALIYSDIPWPIVELGGQPTTVDLSTSPQEGLHLCDDNFKSLPEHCRRHRLRLSPGH